MALLEVAYVSTYLGEAMIVEERGNILGQRGQTEGAGVVIAALEVPGRAVPIKPIPDAFWLPPEMPDPWKESCERGLKSGTRY